MRTPRTLKTILVWVALTGCALASPGCDEKLAPQVLKAARRIQASQFWEGSGEAGDFRMPVPQGGQSGSEDQGIS